MDGFETAKICGGRGSLVLVSKWRLPQTRTYVRVACFV